MRDRFTTTVAPPAMQRVPRQIDPPVPPRWHSPRYGVQGELARGGMGVVYRAFDRLTRRQVAVKRIELEAANISEPPTVSLVHPRLLPSLAAQFDPSRTRASPDRLTDQDQQRLALAREFRILATLRHPNIISVLDYGFDQLGRSYLVMELLEDAPTLSAAFTLYTLEQRLALIAQLMQALRYLHRAGVLHCDLKPENVLLTQIDGVPTVKVVDFGIAVWKHYDASPSDLLGTMAYIAPEVMAGAAHSELSDLYALGVICYEVCGGHHPYDHLTNDAEMLRAARRGTADLSILPVGEPARTLVGSLLSPKPELRPRDADDALARWCAANGLGAAAEPPEIRDSFLRFARFVGRSSERVQLSRALDDAVAGRGSAWLVSGASGVGKSRLIEEVKAAALVRGMLVLRGEARDTGGLSFALWRPILRELALYVPLFPLEIAVLSSILDDLGEVLAMPINPVASLDRDGNLRRLGAVVEAVLKRLDVPVLVILEDLHWATFESTALLRRVMAGLSGRHGMLIGSVRSDERPAWLEELSTFNELALAPFDSPQIGALCEAVIGRGAASGEMITALRQASGGNPFFVLEVLRSVAEERGTLDDVASGLHNERQTLRPASLLDRRLALVPVGARDLLELAAVAGRQIDVAMLAQLHKDPPDWLAQCAVVSVLEVADDNWRFAHDKLREQLLAQLAPARRRQLHARVATALKQAHGERTPAAVMAYHLEAAGQLVTALPHLLNAAEEALGQGALGLAQSFAEAALSYADVVPLSLHDTARARLVMIETGYARSRREQAVTHMHALLDEMGLTGINGASSRLSMAAQLLRAWRRKPLPIDRDEPGIQVWELVLRALLICFHVEVLVSESEAALQLLLLSHNISRSLAIAGHEAAARCGIAYALSQTPLRGLAPGLLAGAAEMLSGKNSGSQVALHEAAGLVSIHLGNWLEANRHFQSLEEVAAANGDERNFLFAVLQGCLASEARGQLDVAQARLEEMSQYATTDDDTQLRGLTLNRRGWLFLHRGQLANARTTFETALRDDVSYLVKVAQSGGMVLASWLLGEVDVAERHALEAVLLLRSRRLGGHAGVFAVPAIVRVLLGVYHARPTSARKQAALAALEDMRRYAWQLPIGRPPHELLLARHAHWQGHHQQARHHYANSIAAARRLSMPLDHAVAVIEVAAMTSGDAGARRRAEAAQKDLRRRGALGWLKLASGAPNQV